VEQTEERAILAVGLLHSLRYWRTVLRTSPCSPVPSLTPRIILETDAAAIAGRVTRPKPDTTDIVINEQTLMNACE
jgi:hypothetical protein